MVRELQCARPFNWPVLSSTGRSGIGELLDQRSHEARANVVRSRKPQPTHVIDKVCAAVDRHCGPALVAVVVQAVLVGRSVSATVVL